MRKFTEDHLVIASHNKGKIIEIEKLLSPYVKQISSARDHHLPEPEETGKTFHDNARLKALTTVAATQLPALADDSGICVEGLGGAPGIYSARWCNEDKNYQTAIDRIFKELNGAPAVTEFVTVFALAWPDGEVAFVEGRVRGTLLPAPRGQDGFGYDVYFVPDGYHQTFAELGAGVKDQISARARAMQELIRLYF
jgi:XTP/dITP diphosphohydrolase